MLRFIKVMVFVFIVAVCANLAFAEGYKYNLEAIKNRSKERIKTIQAEIKERERREAQEKKVREIEDIFNEAEMLYGQGELKQAQELYERAYKLAGDTSLKDYKGTIINRQGQIEAEEKAEQERIRQEELARKEEERKEKEEELARQKAEQERQRQEAEAQRKQELAEQKAEQERLKQEAETKRKEEMARQKAELEQKRKDELTRKEQERRQKAEELKRKQEEEAQKIAELERLIAQADPVYQEALSAFKKRDYPQAKEKFLKVREIYPDYERTNYYLEKIEGANKHLEAAEKAF